MLNRTLTLAAVLACSLPQAVLGGYDEGVAAFQAGNYEVAVQEFRTLIQGQPDAHAGQYMLGVSYSQLGRKEEALHHLRKAYDLNPNDLATKIALGEAFFAVRRYADVANLLNGVDLSSLPLQRRVRVLQIRSWSNERASNPNRALDDASRLAKLTLNDAQAQFRYGQLASKAGQLDLALRALERAVALSPGELDFRRAYVITLIDKGRVTRDRAAKQQVYYSAAQAAAQMAGMTGSYEDFMLQLTAELGAGLNQQAIATGESVSRHPSANWLAHFYLGQAYSSNGQYPDAVAPLQQALKKADPANQSMVLKNLGYVYEMQHDFANATYYYQYGGDQAAVARVQEKQATAESNRRAEGENAQIQAMDAEAAALEAELRALEDGGGGRP